jgi:hypothetical protein
MGFFSSISEGIFAAKVVKNIARHLDVHTSQLPEWVFTGAKDSAPVHKIYGYTPEQAALSILEHQGQNIVEEMANK